MSKNELKIINFSNGIRSTEIQHNFSALQEQIKKERISVAGSGISYGLNFKLKDFTLKISEGCLIDSEGNEVYIDETEIQVERPILLEKIEKAKVVDSYNRIFLSEIPYAITRDTLSQNADIDKCGVTVTVTGMTGSAAKINIASIEQNVIHLDTSGSATMKDIKVDVSYYYTYKRRDALFIDKEYGIQYRTGITSPSPSIPSISHSECTYILGYIETDGHAVNEDNIVEADATFVKEFKSIRNVYTDESNKLYLCGTPFDSIKVIHMVEPKDPEEYTLWYDETVNKLKIWRHTDKYEFVDSIVYESSNPNNPQEFATNIKYQYGKKQLSVYINNKKLKTNEYEEGIDLSEMQKLENEAWSTKFKILVPLTKGDTVSYRITRYDGYAEWVSINDSSYVMAQERFIWSTDYLTNLIATKEHDLQHFFFDSKLNRNMMFIPGKNSLEIMIDQIPLHSDQFEEITANDAIVAENADDIRRKLTKYYNYTDDFNLSVLQQEYENIGLGFKLNAPMLKATYVEAIVTHRVNSNPLSKRFQRTATFVAEGGLTYKKYQETSEGTVYQEPKFTSDTTYRYKENQLEVFLNGRRLERDIEYVEVAGSGALQGSPINEFEILSAAGLQDGDKITYKVTTSIYSYDHLEGLLSGFETKITDMEQNVSYCMTKVEENIRLVEEYTEKINVKMESLINIEDTFDNKYMSKQQAIGKNNLEASLYQGIANASIYKILSVENNNKKFDVTDTCNENDFVILTNLSGNKMLCRGSDYSIVEENGYIYLEITTTSVANGDQIYLSGIRFNRA